MSNATISISRTSLACPLGLDSASAGAAMAAGLTAFEALEDETKMSRLSILPPDMSRQGRMEALTKFALAEALAPLPVPWPRKLPVFVALPEDGSGAPWDERALLKTIFSQVHRTGAVPVFSDQSMVRLGRAGLFAAMQRAVQVLSGSDCALALVGAVDSLVDAETLSILRERQLCLGPSNFDGRIPGEGAGFFIVSNTARLNTGLERARLLTIELGEDLDSFARYHRGECLNTANGLTRLFSCLRASFSQRCDGIFSAQPGEGYWGREFSYAYLRNEPLMPEPLTAASVGAEIGDAGAASASVALARAVSSFQPKKGKNRSSGSALVYGVSDLGTVGGCLTTGVSFSV